MNVLYVSHTAQLGGAERSLLELLARLPTGIAPTVAAPPGPLTGAVRDLGVPVFAAPEIEGGSRLRARESGRAVAGLAGAAATIRRCARYARADVVHANTIRAGLAAVLASEVGGAPAVVHVRDCLPPGPVRAVVRRLLTARSAVVLANSRYTARMLDRRGGADVRVAYPTIDFDRFDPDTISRADARARLTLGEDAAVLGVVAQLTPWKGQLDAIRTLAHLRRTRPDALLLLVGTAQFTGSGTRFDNRAYERTLHRAVTELGLDRQVWFLGAREDVPTIMRALDLLLVPSWEEPFGRVVVEALAIETPVLATSVGGPAQVITDGADGLLLPPRRPSAWASAAEELLSRPDRIAEMGRRGRQSVVMRFGAGAQLDAVLRAYDDACRRTARTPGSVGRVEAARG